ncbi:hypothetical protein KL953_35505 [Mycolicibacterium goodii]|uniref:hypothetical protein n=1 Tax=Mycolicibacterium goodii TaxID=134601 RepID=UPI001BDC3E6C|nr:hypothetical protein [Mycolicibacterium goodii]MBU8814161.1 hypothetical protein [Mycolicibacterium goodii]
MPPPLCGCGQRSSATCPGYVHGVLADGRWFGFTEEQCDCSIYFFGIVVDDEEIRLRVSVDDILAELFGVVGIDAEQFADYGHLAGFV